MKKILFLTYYYAPYNITGSFRIIRLIKHLAKNGIKPFIITAKHNTTKISDDLNGDIPSSASIIYKKDILEKYQTIGSHSIHDPVKRNFINDFKILIKDFLLSPDIQIIWSISVIYKACRLIKQEGIKYLFVNGGPFSLFVSGVLIKKITGVKLILDFRDPWASNPNQLNQSTIRKMFNKYWERICVRNSHTIISVNEKIIAELSSLNPKGKYVVLPNSIDTEDFTNLSIHERNPSNFIFGYAGKFDVNSNVYNPEIMLEGLKKIILLNEISRKVKLRIFGEVNTSTRQYIASLGISENIELLGYCKREQVIKGLSDCNAFIQFHFPLKIYNALSIKMFEYTYFRKPILSINTGSGILADFILKSRIGYVCENDNIESITKHFNKILSININEFEKNINTAHLEKYEINNQISTLLEIFN